MSLTCILVRISSSVHFSGSLGYKRSLQAALSCIAERPEKGPWGAFPYQSTRTPRMLVNGSEGPFWACLGAFFGSQDEKGLFSSNLYGTSWETCLVGKWVMCRSLTRACRCLWLGVELWVSGWLARLPSACPACCPFGTLPAPHPQPPSKSGGLSTLCPYPWAGRVAAFPDFGVANTVAPPACVGPGGLLDPNKGKSPPQE
jgi:hypothetical protein